MCAFVLPKGPTERDMVCPHPNQRWATTPQTDVHLYKWKKKIPDNLNKLKGVLFLPVLICLIFYFNKIAALIWYVAYKPKIQTPVITPYA